MTKELEEAPRTVTPLEIAEWLEVEADWNERHQGETFVVNFHPPTLRAMAATVRTLLSALSRPIPSREEVARIVYDAISGHIEGQGAGGVGVKNGESRGVPLHPRAVAALANLPHRTGKVFRRHYGGVRWNGTVRPVGSAYVSRGTKGGGMVKTGWAAMLKAAKIANFTPHDCRHTWATWHYSANKDVAALMALGGWKDLKSVMRYTHVNVAHLAPSIGRIWGASGESPIQLTPQALPTRA